MKHLLGIICLYLTLTLGGYHSHCWGTEPDIGTPPHRVEALLRQELAKAPRTFASQAALIRFLSRQGRSEEAVLLLRLVSDLQAPAAQLLSAQVHWDMGESKSARQILQTLKPDYKEVWIDALELWIGMDFIEGQLDTCQQHCDQLIGHDPLNKTARLYQARLHARYGRYNRALKELDTGAAVEPNDIEILSERANILDIGSDPNQALQIRLRIAGLLKTESQKSLPNVLAGAATLRSLGRMRAAHRYLERALAYAPADPRVVLEKAKLFHQTSSLAVAHHTLRKLIRTHSKHAAAYAELAEINRTLQSNPTTVEHFCNRALKLDPTLVQTRARLVQYALIRQDWKKAENLMAENKATNPHHPVNSVLEQAIRFLKNRSRGNTAPPPDTLSQPAAISLGDILAARSDYDSSLQCYQIALVRDPNHLTALKGTGVAALRCGDFQQATTCLERAFTLDPFDIVVKNKLELLKTLRRARVLEGDGISIHYQPGDRVLADYARFLAHNYLDAESRRLQIDITNPLRIYLCRRQGDLDVITRLIPNYGCGCGPSGPEGSIYFKSLVFVWTPEAITDQDTEFRFDEALHRGVTQFVFQQAWGPHGPLWFREALSRYLGKQSCHEWRPTCLKPVLKALRSGQPFPLRNMEDAFLGELHEPSVTYSVLALERWTQRYGLDRVLALAKQWRQGQDTRTALEKTFETSLEALEGETLQAIRDQYQEIRTEPQLKIPLSAQREQSVETEAARLERARHLLQAKRYSDARQCLQPLLRGEAPPTLVMLLSGRIAWALGEPSEAIDQIQLGLSLEALRRESKAQSIDYETLGLALLKLEREREAARAFQRAIQYDPYDNRRHGPHGRLLTILKKQNPRPQHYYEVLAGQCLARRADARIRMELGAYHLKQSELQQALVYFASAAGIRPDWIAAHRRLAETAHSLKRWHRAYASYRVLFLHQPHNARYQQRLLHCANELGRQQEAQALIENTLASMQR